MSHRLEARAAIRGTVRAEELTKVSLASWNAAVSGAASGSSFQTTHWADYQRAYLGARPHYLIIKSDEGELGRLLVLEAPRAGESLRGRSSRFLAVAARFLGALSWREGPLISEAAASRETMAAVLAALRRLATERQLTGIDNSYHVLLNDARRIIGLDNAPDIHPHVVGSVTALPLASASIGREDFRVVAKARVGGLFSSTVVRLIEFPGGPHAVPTLQGGGHRAWQISPGRVCDAAALDPRAARLLARPLGSHRCLRLGGGGRAPMRGAL